MAYIIGLLRPEEKEELERRGWEVESPPKGFVTPSSALRDGMQYGAVYVNNNMLQIMSGNDWDKGPPKTTKVLVRDIEVTERMVDIPTRCPKCGADFYDKNENDLHVWELSDQRRNGHLQNDGDTDDEDNSTDGINTADSDLEGGDNYVNNVEITCSCGCLLAGGTFKTNYYEAVRVSFLLEVEAVEDPRVGPKWVLHDTFSTEEDAEKCLADRRDGGCTSALRVIRTITTGDKTEHSILHTWYPKVTMPSTPPTEKKTDAKKRAR